MGFRSSRSQSFRCGLWTWFFSIAMLGWAALDGNGFSCRHAHGQESSQPSLPGAGPVQKVFGGFQFTEGPAYDGSKYLYFTDIPNNRIHRVDVSKYPEQLGALEVFLEDSKSCNGLMFDGKGSLVGCQMKGNVVAWDTTTKQSRLLTNRYQDRPYNACNDLVIDRTGGIYFTDPRYAAPEPWPQGIEAFYYRSAEGKVTRLGEKLIAPNGIILSPDEKALVVVASMQKEVMIYDVLAPGEIGEGRVLFEIRQPPGKSTSGGDGLSVDVDGSYYITTDLGVQCVDANGALLGILSFPEAPANCAFGGSDGRTLFATCRTGLYSVRMPRPGHVFTGVVR
jgi:gluconolactonase